MQFQNLQNLKEVDNNIQLQSSLPKEPTEFTVRPTGEVSIKGNPDPELIRQLLTSADYQQDQNRKHEAAIKNQQQRTEMMIVGTFGATFLMVVISLFISFNQRNQGASNGESFRGVGCQQIR
ncbi:MAG: hypothetical protein ACKPCP_14140 [Sphaerospermopsis kisseleviana]